MTAIIRFFAFRRSTSRRARGILLITSLMGASFFSAAISRAADAVVIASASTQDANGDGQIDAVTLTFTAPMDTNTAPTRAASQSDPGIYIQGYQILTSSGFIWDDSKTTLKVRLTQLGTPDTDATPTVIYNPTGDTLLSLSGGSVASYNGPAVDRAAPALVRATSKDFGTPNLFTNLQDRLNLTFSEPVTLSGLPGQSRWLNLERAILFNKAAYTTGCTDGTGVGPTGKEFNFPQPNAPTAVDPISVTNGGKTITVTFNTADTAPDQAHWFWAVPILKDSQGRDAYCKISVDTANASLIRDAANNAASTARLNTVSPDDILLSSTNTLDANRDGVLDSVELVFDQNVLDSSIASGLAGSSIAKGAESARITGFTTGTTVDDNKVILSLADVSWATEVTPVVSYAKPAACGGSSGAGFRGQVLNPGYYACVATFSVTATDAAAPVLLSSQTADANTDGTIDAVRVTFSEAIAAGTAKGWKIAGADATGFSKDGANAVITFAPGSGSDTDAVPVVTYTQRTLLAEKTIDALGNQVSGLTRQVSIDGAAPRIVQARVEDANHDGSIDSARLTYSEPVTADATSAADYTIGGTLASALAQPSGSVVTLDVPEIGNSASQAIAYNAGTLPVFDGAGLPAPSQSLGTSSVSDAAAPVGVIAVSPGAPIKAGTATISVTYTEAMKNDVQPTVTLGSATASPLVDAEHTNGWTADQRIWQGTISIAADQCSVPTGCDVTVTAVDAKDVAGNVQFASSLLTQIDTVAPAAASDVLFGATVADGHSAPANTLNMFADAFSIASTLVAGDAEGGRAYLTLDGTRIDSTSTPIGIDSTSVIATTTYADRAALQAAVTEGTHTLSVQVCDDAANCTDAASGVQVNADYTPVSVAIGSPNGGEILAGGSTVNVSWTGDALASDFDHADLAYSTDNGSTFTSFGSGSSIDGTTSWVVPTVEAAGSLVRIRSFDVSGNELADVSDAVFSIDSNAPQIAITAPLAQSMWLPAGASTTVRWDATDATIAQNDAPITIEYSADYGSTYTPINDGQYSRANDGEEFWSVPAGAGFGMYLRISATDAAGHTASLRSVALARGVDGYVADRLGRVFGFGSTPATAHSSRIVSGDWVRGMATLPDGTGGYVLGSRGQLYPFAGGDNVIPSRPRTLDLRTDRARGLALYSNTSGYVLDSAGRLYRFGGAPLPTISRTVPVGTARAVVLLPNRSGGYVLDMNGKLYPFALGSNRMPSVPVTSTLSAHNAVGVMLRADGRSGYVLDSYGRLFRFGGAPSVRNSGTSSGAYAKSIVRITDTAGYWLDGRGALHPFGAAVGAPASQVLPANYARGAAS